MTKILFKKLASESETQLNKEKEQERKAEEMERKRRGGEPKKIELKFPTSISKDCLILDKNEWGIVPSPACTWSISAGRYIGVATTT